MTDLEKRIWGEVQADSAYVSGLRRWFHQHPELAGEEYETQRRIEEELDKIGVPHRRAAVTGVIGEVTGTGEGEGESVLLRADIDALPISEESGAAYASLTPGNMHACGHDGHTAALLGAARALMRCRDSFPGKVLLVFQPGEETGYGGVLIARSGEVDEARTAFGVHMAPEIDAGKIVVMPGANNASVDMFRVKVHGLGSHVSAPERGVDAAYILSQIVVAAQALVTRRTSPMDNVLLGIGTLRAGTAYNVVAQEAEMEGTIRALTPENREKTVAGFERLVKATAEVYGGRAEIEWLAGTPALLNDPGPTRMAQRAAFSLLGEENVITARRPSLAGDDFSEFINRVGGVYAYVGSGNDTDPRTRAPIHNSTFDIDERALSVAAAMHAVFAARFLRGELG